MSHAGHEIDRFVERQMRNWELLRQQAPPAAVAQTTTSLRFCIAISRELGSGGEQLGECLSRCTGWTKYDREILDYMAGHEEVSRRMYEMLDERQRTWLQNLLEPLEPLGVDAMATREQYFPRLIRAVLTIAQQEHAIFIGRGAHFILPSTAMLAVRVVAPLKHRVRRVMEAQGLTEREARRRVVQTESERAEFLARHFGPRPYDPRRYDLVLNSASMTTLDMCALVRLAVRRKSHMELPPLEPAAV